MALHFGWTWCFGADKQEDPDNKSPESLALNDAQQYFYWNCLPWLLFYVGIHCVTKETIPIIVSRMRVLDTFGPALIREQSWAKKTPEEYLEAFIGFDTNVGWSSDAEFLNKVRDMLKERLALGGKTAQRRAEETMRNLRQTHQQHIAKKSA